MRKSASFMRSVLRALVSARLLLIAAGCVGYQAHFELGNDNGIFGLDVDNHLCGFPPRFRLNVELGLYGSPSSLTGNREAG
jgi:hypothetical protein